MTGDNLIEKPEGRFVSGYVAFVGAPNVGKSTLVNRLLDHRLSIVTAKPQTTRRRILGILNGEGHQILLLDTPGLMDAKYELHHAMLREVEDALKDADLAVCLVDATVPPAVSDVVRAIRVPRILAVNKVDRLSRREEVLPVLAAYGAMDLFPEIVPLSALRGDGVDELLRVISSRLPEGPPFYPLDQIAEQPERFFVGELVREHIFERYSDEIPYSTEVVVDQFKERPGAKDFIGATVFVEAESQKGILIGQGGQAIRALGEDARRAIEDFLGREVYLELRVKVLPKWRRETAALRRFGYRA